MKVFISWSGERSKKVAELLGGWVPIIIQAVKPWLSSKDIDRGALWFTEISNQLANTTIGIICLTKENKNKPWILFESGALAKGLTSNRVCTFLIDLSPTDLENPLAQFNHTFPIKESVWELIRTINSTLQDNALKESILEKNFNNYWPEFDDDLKKIISSIPEVKSNTVRNENDIMLDVLTTVRLLDKRLRNIESNFEKVDDLPEKEIISKDNTSLAELRSRITTLVKNKNNFTNAVIIEVLHKSTGIDAEIIETEIESIRKKLNAK